ncbi:MAG: tyrosine-type recombinase/integrase [Boseongicola sp. SB0664_bin_43]|uniref:Tyrosine-type recombinase/integrase n=1 Tax=Boseongicola sp. SB0664_bin_43 TaxID=2604844 RepID=A0A6B0Y435_9RHOB|nr:tyrosine-type recombinase/integrase [Boseongicola sp. SB0664_bin_43]MYG03386.1 tyrosine-type recombinase/integrase [Terriglobia bacterium]
MTDLASQISGFFRVYLPRDRRTSRHTIDSYACCFTHLVRFAGERLGVRPAKLQIEDLTALLILDFLDALEGQRGNAVTTRNARLAAIKSFFRYLEYRVPACLDLACQIQAIPLKRTDQTLIDYLDRDELQALLDAPGTNDAAGIRDRAMLHVTYAAGLRVSELTGLLLSDISQPELDTIHVAGKGRRERVLPLWKETQSVLRDWLAIRPSGRDNHLFLNARGAAMSRHGFAHRLALHVATAQRRVPSLTDKRVSPHVLRHSCAVHTLEATGDIRKVSLWLGHASIRSTEAYLRVDPIEKLEVLAAKLPPTIAKGSFKDAPDRLLAVLADARTAA